MNKLFIDDIRDPPDDTWITVRSFQEAILYIEINGLPDIISFDHDLGLAESGYDIAKWIVDKIIDNEIDMPEKFMYNVHSMNPIGKKNISCLMDNFAKYQLHRKGDINGQEKEA